MERALIRSAVLACLILGAVLVHADGCGYSDGQDFTGAGDAAAIFSNGASVGVTSVAARGA